MASTIIMNNRYENTQDKYARTNQLANAKNEQLGDALWSILPSYYMYSNTINTGLHETHPEPPTYDMPSFPASVMTSSGESSVGSELTDLDTQVYRIKDNLIDNIHKLKNFSNSGNTFADCIDISIKFLQRGSNSIELDPRSFEFHQGDYVQGYMLINNIGNIPVPFETFSIVLEGEVNRGTAINRFLQMYEFSASYNGAQCESSENLKDKGPYILVDDYEYQNPLDGTFSGFGTDKLVQPNVTYKIYFTFKLPSKLLDCTCGSTLCTHTSLPPSLGGLKKDFSTSAVRYNVWARFIGKISKYTTEVVHSSPDEFVVLKATAKPFRVVPRPIHPGPSFALCKRQYDSFFATVNRFIAEGQQLLDGETASSSSAANEKANLDIKIQEHGDRLSIADQSYNLRFPIYKMNALLKTSTWNALHLKTPKTAYTIEYIPPKQFRGTNLNDSSWQLNIPIEISVINHGKPIEIKSIKVELVVLTLESSGNAIPFEFHHDLIFNKTRTGERDIYKEDFDSFLNNLVTPIKKLSDRLQDISRDVKATTGREWSIDSETYSGVKALAGLRITTDILRVQDTRVEQGQWNEFAGKITKNLNVYLDLSTAQILRTGERAFDQFTLVPNFQSCHLCRMYYLNFILELSNYQTKYMKIPIYVENNGL